MIKQLAYTFAPRMASAISASRGRRRSHGYVREWGLFDLNQRLVRALGDRVVAGPFEGLRLTTSAQCEHIGPFLLGTYELELAGAWSAFLQRRFDQIIDVGANFGYYAVGLASRFPRTPVIAFDTDWWAREAVREMAAVNGTKNVAVKSFCSPSWLAAHLAPNALVVSDCEGGERMLFSGRWIPSFETATLVVELHEDLAPGVTADLRSMFQKTHDIQEIQSRSETPQARHVPSFTADEMRRLSQEIRASQTWFVMSPRASRSSS